MTKVDLRSLMNRRGTFEIPVDCSRDHYSVLVAGDKGVFIHDGWPFSQ
jgi:hypothetical protein